MCTRTDHDGACETCQSTDEWVDPTWTEEDSPCICAACQPGYRLMRVCATCGNKRCPGAADHRNTCTGSNEPGQPGSLYADPPTHQEPDMTDQTTSAKLDSIYDEQGEQTATLHAIRDLLDERLPDRQRIVTLGLGNLDALKHEAETPMREHGECCEPVPPPTRERPSEAAHGDRPTPAADGLGLDPESLTEWTWCLIRALDGAWTTRQVKEGRCRSWEDSAGYPMPMPTNWTIVSALHTDDEVDDQKARAEKAEQREEELKEGMFEAMRQRDEMENRAENAEAGRDEMKRRFDEVHQQAIANAEAADGWRAKHAALADAMEVDQ